MTPRDIIIGHTAANKLFRHISSVTFKYEPYGNGSFDHDLRTYTPGYGKAIKVCEPLFSTSSQQANQLVNAQKGTASSYQDIWLSRHNVPMQSRVIVNSHKTLYVNKKDNYKVFMGIFVYYLGGRSDVN